MEEKKLTDEEIIKALEHCLNGDYKTKCKECPYDDSENYCQAMDRDALDLIHRLQDENERQRKEIDILTKVYASSKRKQTKKSLLETIDKQKAEIERLTKDLNLALDIKETIGGIGKQTAELLSENENLLKENAELQKQLEDMEEQRDKQAYIAEELVQEKHRWTEQTEKDTAKEILQGFNKWLKQAISDSYDKSVKGSIHYGGKNSAFHEVKELVEKVAKEKGVEVE